MVFGGLAGPARRHLRRRPERRVVGRRVALAARLLVDRAARLARSAAGGGPVRPPGRDRCPVHQPRPHLGGQPARVGPERVPGLSAGSRAHLPRGRGGLRALAHEPGRVLGVGVALGAVVLVHLQIALLAAGCSSPGRSSQAVRTRTARPILELAGAGLVAIAISAWWWVPRVAATIDSGGLLLGGFPGSPSLRVGPGRILHGVRRGGHLRAARPGRPGRASSAARSRDALPRLDRRLRAARPHRPAPRRVGPGVGAPRLVARVHPADGHRGGGADDDRRPAAGGPVRRRGRGRRHPAVGPRDGRLGPARQRRVGCQGAPASASSTPRRGTRSWPTSRDRVRADGHHVAVTYDAYEAWVWSLSGAQVPSLWLPGPFKLGFDPERLTGVSYLDRLRAQETAFAGGLPAICDFAAAYRRRLDPPRRRGRDGRPARRHTRVPLSRGPARTERRHHRARPRRRADLPGSWRDRRAAPGGRDQVAAAVPRRRGSPARRRDRRPGSTAGNVADQDAGAAHRDRLPGPG